MSKTTNDGARPKAAEALQESITQRIIDDLKAGVPTWVKPWKDRGGAFSAPGLPMNAISERPYSGVNVLLLWSQAHIHGYRSQGWMTYQQGNQAGGRVKKGEKSSSIIFTKFLDREDKESGEMKKIPVLRTYSVFNVDQFEKLPERFYEQEEPKPEDERFDAAVKFCKDTRINTHFGGNRACYNTNRDFIEMPNYGSFVSDDAFFGTWCHELIHATGHKERLARVFGSRFGDHAYAFEELVAELGSAFTCAQLGYLPTTRTAASYIDHWLKVLEKDHKAIVSAASYASHGARWLEEQALHAVHDDTPDVERDDLVAVA